VVDPPLLLNLTYHHIHDHLGHGEVEGSEEDNTVGVEQSGW